MTPSASNALRTLMMTLIGEVAPQVPEGYAQASVHLIGLLQLFAAEELDRAAALRVWENAEIRALLHQATEVVVDAELVRRLRAAAAGSDEDLLVSALDVSNAELRRLLIEMHAAVEEIDGERAGELERAIWRFLSAAAVRRALPF
ncbi:MAG TPA: hypothetical protein VEB21_06690 [Terriglobales bacterium]|nr:hypothetical protein [Terriglobales bacterium]